jgi:solute carrier family 10 (sodium/bile acid cotransporter), member 7
MKLDWFLLSIAAAVGLALLAPSIGASGSPVPFSAIALIGVSLVFFLHGANLSREALRAGALNWRLHLFVQSATFILFPVVGAGIYFATAGWLPPQIRLGFFYLGALSSTISSAVATVAIAGGNIPAAIFNATLSGLIGMVLTPALIGLVQGGGGELSLLEAISDIAVKLLLPFALGHLLRPWLGELVGRHKPWLTKLDRSVIILIVYTAFCNSTKAGVWSQFSVVTFLAVAALVILWLAAIIIALRLMSRQLGFNREDEIVAVICGSQKSLANGAPIANVLFGASPMLGAILLPLMLFHPLQLTAGSALARRYATQAPR